METYICHFCHKESTDEDEFSTDLIADINPEDMLCEDCYDEMNTECNQ